MFYASNSNVTLWSLFFVHYFSVKPKYKLLETFYSPGVVCFM